MVLSCADDHCIFFGLLMKDHEKINTLPLLMKMRISCNHISFLANDTQLVMQFGIKKTRDMFMNPVMI